MKIIKRNDDFQRCRFCGTDHQQIPIEPPDGFLIKYNCSSCMYSWKIDEFSKILHVERFDVHYNGVSRKIEIDYIKKTTTMFRLEKINNININQNSSYVYTGSKFVIESQTNKILIIKKPKDIIKYIKRFDILM